MNVGTVQIRVLNVVEQCVTPVQSVKGSVKGET